MTAVWDDGWSTGRQHDTRPGSVTVGYDRVYVDVTSDDVPAAQVRNTHTVGGVTVDLPGRKVRKGRSPEQIDRDRALEDMRMADRLDAQNSNPARFHGQLCPCWKLSKRGHVRVSLDVCTCWRKQQLLTTVAIFREAGWRWVG